jgi:hypothetical protein
MPFTDRQWNQRWQRQSTNDRRGREPQESTMNKFFAAIAALTLVLATAALAAPANASTTYLYPPAQNEGTSN